MKPKIIIILSSTIILIFLTMFAFSKFGLQKSDWWRLQLTVFPDNTAALVNVANGLQMEDGFKEDLSEYKNILRLQAEGLTKELKPNIQVIERVQKVLDIYKRVIELDKDNLQAHYQLARISQSLGLAPIAFAGYLKVVEIDPYFIEAHFRLANLYGEVSDYAQSARAFSQILTILPDDETVYIRVIDMILDILEKKPENSIMRHSRRDVIERFTDLVNRKPKTAGLFYNLGVVLDRIGESQRAASAYRSALDLDKKHVKTLNNLGNILLRSGKDKEAEQLFNKVLKINPKLIAAWMNLGVIMARRGNLQAAKEAYQKVIEFDPKNGEAYFKLGYIKEAAGQLREAKKMYSQAVKFDPENEEIYYNSGNVNIKLGLGAEALVLYKKALAVNLNHLNSAINGCLLSAEIGKWDDARYFCFEAEILGYVVLSKISGKL